jgi:hypothetical protein
MPGPGIVRTPSPRVGRASVALQQQAIDSSGIAEGDGTPPQPLCRAQLLRLPHAATINAKYLQHPLKSNDVLMIDYVLDFQNLPWQVLRPARM